MTIFRRRALARQAKALEVQRDWGRAAQVYAKLAALPGGRASEQMRLARALEENGQVDRATAAYRQGVSQFPTAPNVHRQQALHLLRLNRRPQAVEAFLRGLALVPEDETLRADIQREGVADADVVRRTLIAFLSSEQPAERQLTWAGGARHRRKAARAAAKAGRWSDAIKGYERLIASGPPSSQDLIRLGHALKASGKLAEAEQGYWRALAAHPRSPDAYLQLGHVLKLRGHIEDSLLSYLIAWRLQPGHQDVETELMGQGWTRARLHQVANQTWAAVAREDGLDQHAVVRPEALAASSFDLSPPDHLSRMERAVWGDLFQVL